MSEVVGVSVVFALVAVLTIIYLVPVVVYGAASARGWADRPTESSPQAFLLGVLVTKVGTALAFVLLLWLSRDYWVDRWLVYALIWFAMFTASEVGDAISGRQRWREALLGVVSEGIYAPAAAYAADQILGIG
jgi:hypothetical protein